MTHSTVPDSRQQGNVNAFFQARTSFWRDIYASDGVEGRIYRERQAAALAWIDGLNYAPGSRVLEIGCGAGLLATALAGRGFYVYAIDSSEDMVKLARQRAAESGTANMLSLDVGDVYALAFDDESFDLVVALGVIPWLTSPVVAVQEMARVTRPGGHVILTADNRARLHSLLDPWQNTALVPLRRHLRDMLVRVGLPRVSQQGPRAILHDRRFIDETLASAELMKVTGMTLGFGPFSLRGRRILPGARGITLHRWLQRLADRNVPVLRACGAHYLALARKSTARTHAHEYERGAVGSTSHMTKKWRIHR